MRQKFLTLIPVLLILAACAMNPATGRPHFTLVSEDAEYELGHKEVSTAIKEDGLYTELPELLNTYRALGAELVAVSERPEKPFDFIIIDSPIFNAWAIPGYVNFYRGMLPYLNSESELLGIMGHEVGHITARHTVRHMSTGVFTQILVTGAAIAIAANTDSDVLAQSAIVAGGVLAGVGLRAYGRGAEYEADDLGARYLERMGRAPSENANALRTLALSDKFMKKLYFEIHGEEMPDSPIYHILASHPDSEDRVARQSKAHGTPELRSFERAPQFQNDTVGREKYLKLINGLAYGPKKEHGVITRNRIYMPKDRFMLSIPDDYMATNGMFSKGWLVADLKNKRRLNMSTHLLKRSAGPEEAMRILLPYGRNIQILDLPGGSTAARAEVPIKYKTMEHVSNSINEALFGYEDSIIEGLPGGAVVYVIPGANSDNKDSDGNLTRRYHAFIFHTIKRDVTDEDRKVFDGMIRSYKSLSEKEAERIEPLRINTYMVRPGDSVASISRNMPFGALREEIFRTLNGMDEADEVKPGMLMKVVADKNTIR